MATILNFPLLPAPDTRRPIAKVRHDDCLYDLDQCEHGIVALYQIADPDGARKVIGDMELPVSVVLQLADQLKAELGIHTVADAQAWEQAIGARVSAIWALKTVRLPHGGLVS